MYTQSNREHPEASKLPHATAVLIYILYTPLGTEDTHAAQ